MSAYMLPDKAVAAIAERLGYCQSIVSLGGVRFSCDRPDSHEGEHGGTYPSDNPTTDVTVTW